MKHLTPLVQNPSLKHKHTDILYFFKNPVDCEVMMHDIKNPIICKSKIKLPDIIA